MAIRKNQTAVSDEEIIAALLQSGTIAQAAELTGIGQRTIYDRMGDRDFRAAYNAAKSDIVRTATLTMNRKLSAAVDVIMGIMEDKDNAAAVRLQAAKMLIDNAARFGDRLAQIENTASDYAKSPLNFDPSKW